MGRDWGGSPLAGSSPRRWLSRATRPGFRSKSSPGSDGLQKAFSWQKQHNAQPGKRNVRLDAHHGVSESWIRSLLVIVAGLVVEQFLGVAVQTKCLSYRAGLFPFRPE
jgi:hypothetical protein